MISVIIVHYHVEKRLFDLLYSIYATNPKNPYEILVIDNDEKPSIEKKLKKKFPKVRYIKSGKNVGYSGGNNLGASLAKGEFLFFLNPDTVFTTNILDILVGFLQKDTHIGVVAPLLLDKNKHPYLLQGTKKLGILEALVALSFVNKWLPKNPISKNYWNIGWDKTKIKQVDVVPGTALMIRKKVFEGIGKFDERYFLFFEEYDICRRLVEKGYKNFILPDAKLIHFWGNSTEKRNDTDDIFARSRFLYFQKFFGTVRASLLEGVLSVSHETLIVISVLFISAFLRFYGMERFMLFIGDFGWFYLSARDLLLTGEIPLVGIASSHPWIHQGALWTYMLATSLWVGNFHPLSGGYLAACIGVITTFVLYLLAREMINKPAALFASAFFATSPLVIFHSRLPYHTTPIPLFVLLYIYAVYKWVKGSTVHFSLAIFWLAVLYNFELASVILVGPLLVYFAYGFWKKTPWFTAIFSPKRLFFSFLAFLIPMIPMVLYDIAHGFPQTLKFVAWIGYRLLVLFGYPPLHPEYPPGTYAEMFEFLLKKMQEFFYKQNVFIAAAMALASTGFFLSQLIKNFHTKQKEVYFVLALSFFIPLGIVTVSKIPSDAYLPIIFIQASLLIGILFSVLAGKTKVQRYITYVLFGLVCLSNGLSMYLTNFGSQHALPLPDRIAAAEEVLSLAEGKPYTLVGTGGGSQFTSFTMNYEYLTWWLGQPPQKNSSRKIIIKEHEREIILYRK